LKPLNLEINLTAPTSWQALTEQQVIFVAQVLLRQPSKEELLARCLLKFAGLHPVPVTNVLHRYCILFNKPLPSLYRYKNKTIEISDEQMAIYCRQLEYLAEPPGLMKCPSRIAGLYGPDPQLWTNTSEEYLMADRYYRAYSQTQDRAHLYGMVAVLWRKKTCHILTKHLKPTPAVSAAGQNRHNSKPSIFGGQASSYGSKKNTPTCSPLPATPARPPTKAMP
jgi:hypothetical protein